MSAKETTPETTWKCSRCGFTITEPVPPERCSSCGEVCEFLNVTCYLPECGDSGPGNIDPRLK